MARLIFVNRYFFPDHSATSQLLSDLAFDLAGAGSRVLVITSRQRYDDPRAQLPDMEVIKGVTVRRVWTTRFGRLALKGRALDYLSFYVAAGAALQREARPGDVIIAKTDPPLIGVVAAAAARLRRAVLVNWSQDLFPEVAQALGVNALGGGAGKLLAKMRNWSLRRAECNVVLGDLMARRLAGEGIARDRIEVIHNWIGDDVVPVPREHNALHREWGLEDKFVVAYSGNLGRAHEYETILAAAALLNNRERIVFLFIGGGAHMAALQRRVAERRLTNVMIKPYQPRERLAESLSAADVHFVSLLPALEGLIVPSKFYGILSVGRPVVYIGTRRGEIPGIISRERCGVTVGIGDGCGLAAQLKCLCREPGLAQRMGANGRQLFLHSYRKELAFDKWREVLGVSNYIEKDYVQVKKMIREV